MTEAEKLDEALTYASGLLKAFVRVTNEFFEERGERVDPYVVVAALSVYSAIFCREAPEERRSDVTEAYLNMFEQYRINPDNETLQ